METLVLTVHIIIAIIIIVLILIQHGKGADAGATFGAGNAGTVFGASGTGNFLSRTTAILTAIFFATSLGLAVIAKNKSSNLYSLDDTSEKTQSKKTSQNKSDAPGAYPSPEKKPAPQLTTPRKVTDEPVKAIEKTNTNK